MENHWFTRGSSRKQRDVANPYNYSQKEDLDHHMTLVGS